MREKRIASSMGMFDIIKGIGMILIVLGHSFSFSFEIEPGINVAFAIIILPIMQLANALMPAFFIMSGYGFRKRALRDCIKQQAALMLKPFLYALIGVTILHFITRYIMFRSVWTALLATWSVTGGFLLALPQNMEIGNITFYSCGALWFMIALFIAWIILDLIMEKVPEKYQLPVILVVSALGWLIGIDRVTPYCISQGMIAVLFLYIGYKCKKSKILITHWKKKHWLCFLFAFVAGTGISAASGVRDNMADGIWAVGPISILVDMLLAVLLLHVLLQLNRFSNKVLNAFARIGRNSLYIFAIHSVEMHGIPWYFITEKMAGMEMLSYVSIFMLRCVFVAVGVFTIKHINGRKRVSASGLF